MFEADGRVFGDGVRDGTRIAGCDCTTFQYRRPTPDRPLRNGAAEIYRSSEGRQASASLRRWETDAMLLPCGRSGGSPGPPPTKSEDALDGLQCRWAGGNQHQRSCEVGDLDHQLIVEDSTCKL